MCLAACISIYAVVYLRLSRNDRSLSMNLASLHLHWRVSQHKGNSYRSYSLARAYRKDGKNRKEIALKLGKLSDHEVEHWREFLKSVKDPNSFFTSAEDILIDGHLSYLDVAVFSAIWDEWQLDKVFKCRYKKDILTACIARILAVNRAARPKSKSQISNWCRNTILPWSLGLQIESINTSRIFRELNCIEKDKENLCAHLFNLLRQKDPVSMSRVFYDLSSTTFAGSKCVLMKWGHCKEGYKNHIVLAIVVNKDGLPFYWDVLQGGTADATTIAWLLNRLKKRFTIASTTVVFDRGMVSDDNLDLLEQAEIKYISAMDKSQIEKITGIDFASSFKNLGFKSDAPSNFIQINEMTYYREIKLEGKRRYILCFNPQLFIDQRKARDQAIEDFKSFAENVNKELSEAKRDRTEDDTFNKFNRQLLKKKLNGFVNVKLEPLSLMQKDKTGALYSVISYQGAIQIDESAKLKAGRLDGFWLLVTNHNEKRNKNYLMSAPEAIQPYRDKFVIESAFRDIKSFVEVAPVYVWTDKHVKAHFTICLLAYLINRTITLRLHSNPGKVSKEIVAHEKLYEYLSSCQINHVSIKNKNINFYKMTSINEMQMELLQRMQLSHLSEGKILKKMNTAKSVGDQNISDSK